MNLSLLLLLSAFLGAAADNTLASLQPPPSTKERVLFNMIKQDPKEKALFLSTRKFVRQPSAPFPKDDFSFRFMVDLAEEKRFLEFARTGVDPDAAKGPMPEALKKLSPPASAAERMVYEELKSDEKEVRDFLITREWVRQVDANPNTPPPRPKEFKWDHTVSTEEQLKLFKLR